ncbi:Hpt domain-containing protein [Vibrio methylphosphonaticus]|uniref:Hpt domain-containing protein n=1 Tax=Vibrio methylphosphonaticus TaxID=2946866 RepID=UPI00202AA8FE|nr:Hpt domain-containing protein [Vibrio methylphosphonaticus]MCL9774626.1 Hpt domain-containing protein [Vibrio methylphosphonaticus]
MNYMNHDTVTKLGSEIGMDNLPILLGIFTGELVTYQDQLTAGTLSEKVECMKEISHALKSSAASFGAEALCDFALAVDSDAKGEGLQNDQNRVDAMLSHLHATHEQYVEFLNGLD